MYSSSLFSMSTARYSFNCAYDRKALYIILVFVTPPFAASRICAVMSVLLLYFMAIVCTDVHKSVVNKSSRKLFWSQNKGGETAKVAFYEVFLLTVSLIVWAVSRAADPVSSAALMVSLMTPRFFSSFATSLISLALSRAATVASRTASVSSSIAPLCLIILTVSRILVDSSLILFAMFLIASAVCCGVISFMLVAPTLLLLDIECYMTSSYKRRTIGYLRSVNVLLVSRIASSAS